MRKRTKAKRARSLVSVVQERAYVEAVTRAAADADVKMCSSGRMNHLYVAANISLFRLVITLSYSNRGLALCHATEGGSAWWWKIIWQRAMMQARRQYLVLDRQMTRHTSAVEGGVGGWVRMAVVVISVVRGWWVVGGGWG